MQLVNTFLCDSGEQSFLGGWFSQNYDGTPDQGYFQLRLIQVLPPNLPDPNNVFAPINYNFAIISRYDQTGSDFDTLFNSLNGITSGTIGFEYVDGSVFYYTINNITYINTSPNERLEIDLGPLVNTELNDYDGNGETYGICISQEEPTPSVTPSLTPTPSITPTPIVPVTPTIPITGLTNDCGIITLLPMEVFCDSTNSSGPDVPDGTASIYITGGTLPYTILWENGSTSATITNLTPGSYTVTVTDFYGDFVVTITCIVGSDSFYIDKFVECCDIQCYYKILTNSQTGILSQHVSQSNEIYLTGLTNVNPSLVYTFQGLDGCYEYDSTFLWSGETVSGLTIENTYLDCDRCLPTPTPPVVVPTLCLNGGNWYYEFTPNSGVDSNGNYTWYNNSDGLTLSFNVDDNRWEITPWLNVGTGIMVQNSIQTIPLGTFTNLGNTNTTRWDMFEGECPDTQLTLQVIPTDETCKGFSDGSVVLLGNGGISPYQYRIQGVVPYPNYSNIGLFTNLLPGNYLAEVLDNDGNTYTTPFSIQQGENTTEFNLNVTTNIITESFSTKTWEYSIQITPNVSNLSSNQFITFDLNMTHTMVSRDSGTAIFTSEHEIIKNGVTPITYTTSPTNTNTLQTQCPITVNEITEVFTESVQSLQYNPTDTSIVGTITQTVIIDGGGADCGLDCRMIGNYTTNLQISNVRLINGENCQSIGTAGIKTATQQLNTNDCSALP